jgi:hypothetical protein
MLFFCGSSSIRQFHSNQAGAVSYTAFSGSTIQGLVNHKSASGHGAIVRGMASLPVKKKMLLHFGEVDIDFTYYRNLCKSEDFDEAEFFKQRVQAYNTFLAQIIEEAGSKGLIEGLCILAPQPTPLRGDGFFAATAIHGRFKEEDLRRAGEHTDFSHAARIARLVSFNDMLQANIVKHELVRLYRIDRYMIDNGTGLHEQFYPKHPAEHHPAPRQTVIYWRRALRDEVRQFAKYEPLCEAEKDPVAA